jgi:hypothetical protein
LETQTRLRLAASAGRNLPFLESPLQIARLFRHARLVQKLSRSRGAEVLPILQHPHHFLSGVTSTIWTIPGQSFAFAPPVELKITVFPVGQPAGGLNVVEDNAGGQIGLLELPHGFALPC